MQRTRPESLSNKELLHYAHLTGYDKLAADWVAELVRRLQYYVGDSALDNATASTPDTKQIPLAL